LESEALGLGEPLVVMADEACEGSNISELTTTYGKFDQLQKTIDS
jgi:hypothetical protein